MAFSDPAFQAHRAAVLGTSAPAGGSPGGSISSPSPVSGSGFTDPVFQAHRETILKTPAPKPTSVASKPVAQPQPNAFQQITDRIGKGAQVVQQNLPSFASQVEKQVLGFFSPAGKKPIAITTPNKTPTPLQLTPEQMKSVGTLKVGQKLPDFSSPSQPGSATLKGGTNPPKSTNIIDNIFNKPADYLLNDTGPIGNAIKQYATSIYTNPVETLNPAIKSVENTNPKIAAAIQKDPIYKVETATLQGAIQGALRVYANWNPKVETFLDQQLQLTGKKTDPEIAGNTIGNIIGTIGSFVAGGEIATALKFGRVALPATFAALGQTTLPANTPADARFRNLVTDTVSGTLLEYIKPIANLEKMGIFQQGAEYTKQLVKSLSVMSTQTYLDARSVGASNDQALEMVKDSALLLLGLHGVMIAGKASDYATRSQFKEGSAVFTPGQARATVVGTDLENTPLGKVIIKASMQAEAQGKSIKIDMTAAKKSKIAGALNLETPNGVRITNIEFVSGKGEIPASPQQETTPNGTTEPSGTIPPAEGETVPAEPKPPVQATENPLVRVPATFKSPLEEKAFSQIQEDPTKIVSDYEKAFGNEVSPDLAHTMFQEYRGHNVEELTRPSAAVKSLVYDDLLKTQQGEKNNTVYLSAGGSGSGKTTRQQGAKDDYAIVVDTTFARQSADDDIKKALKNGYDVHISFTYRDPLQAWGNGVLKRVGEEGRTVSEAYFLKSHIEAQKNIVKAYDKYKDNPHVSFAIVNNDASGYKEMSIDSLKNHVYNESVLGTSIKSLTDKAYEQERLSEEQYKATIQDRSQLGAEGSPTGESKSGKKVSGTIPSEERVTQTEYDPSHPWYYKEGGQSLTTSEIKQEAHVAVSNLSQEELVKELSFYVHNPVTILDKNLLALKEIKQEDLKKDSTRYEEVVQGGVGALTEPNATSEDLYTALSLTHNHVYHDEMVLALIDRYQHPDAFRTSVTATANSSVGSGAKTLTLAPSKALTPEEVMQESTQLGLPSNFIKGNGLYERPAIGKTEFKTFLANNTEFKANPVLTVEERPNYEDPTEPKKILVFNGEKIHFSITPEALQISPDKLTVGDTVKVDTNKLTGTVQQMRVYNKENEVLGFNPKDLQNPFSKEAEKVTDEIVKQSDIAKTLSEKLNVPIRNGKFRGPAIGVYKGGSKGPRVIRIKKGGLNTIFHEVAHYLDHLFNFHKGMDSTEMESLLQEYGKPPKDPTKRAKEAFAEYMRYRMTGQTEKIDKYAPKLDKAFTAKIATMPDIKSVLDTATEDFLRWNAQPATSKILSHIAVGGEKENSFKDRAIQSLHDLYTASLDDLHPLSEFSKLATKQLGNIDAQKDPYILARNLRGWVGKAEMFLNEGTFGKDFWTEDAKGKIKMNFTGKSYSEIMKPVNDRKALDDFRVYIVAQRVVNDLAPRKIASGIALQDAVKAIEELDAKHPDFENIAAERRAYKDRLLEFARDNGVLGDGGLAKIRELNKYHVPFYRVMEQTTTKFLGKTKIAGNIGSPIKKIRGSEREIIDPLESDVKDTYAIINAAERNSIGIAMANIAKENFELGRLFEEVARPLQPIKVNVQEVLDQALKGTGAEGIEIPEELAEMVVTLFRPTYAAGPNMLNVNMGDKQKVFEVDSDLFQAIQGLNVEDVGIIMKILSIPAKALRAGATLSPDFSVRNPLRDQFTAFAYSKYGFIPGVDLVRGMFELLKKGDTYNLWKAAGGEHAMFVSMDRKELQKNFDGLFHGNKQAALNIVKDPIEILRIFSEFGEIGTRLGEMRNALARGANPVEAAYASRNITLDFSRIGSKTKAINAIIAFFNANIQGTDTMIRNFKSHPFSMLWKVLVGITLPSVLLYLANRKDPRWKEIPEWQKDLFWIILTPKHIYRIPKPFELGVLFGSVPERALEVMDTKDPTMFNELESTIANGFTPGFLPTALIPIIENITNYSFFLNRPIVSQGKEGLPPPQQSGTYTTEVSKILGEALNYSPAKIDNLIQGYGGGLGTYATSALDKILIGTGVTQTAPPPAAKLEDLPVIKAYMIRPPIGTQSESVNRVYAQYQTTNAQLTYVKQQVKTGDKQGAIDYVKAHPDTLEALTLTGVVNTFSQLNKAADMVRQSDTLTPEQKTNKLDQIGQLQTTIAERALQNLKKK